MSKKMIGSNIIILGLFILFVGVMSLLIYKYLVTEKNPTTIKHDNNVNKKIEKKEEPKKLSLVMVGDALIHDAIYNNAETVDGTYDFSKMFIHIKPIIEKYDLAYYNQESILGGKDIGLSTYPRFNSPYEVGDAFVDMGFNLVSLANNHTLDRGEEALDSSLKYWDSKDGVITAGSYSSFEQRDNINIYETNGISYAFLAYTTVTNGLTRPIGKEYYLNVYDEDQVKKDIESVRDKCDVILVSMHWGVEYTVEPVEEQERIANYLASLGVDVVIGSHPHVIEPITYIDKTLVIYSLGNFISAQRTVDQLSGLMVGLDIIKDPANSEISISNVTADIVFTKLRNLATGSFEFEVIPYNDLDDAYLENKDFYKEKYANVINSLGANVKIN